MLKLKNNNLILISVITFIFIGLLYLTFNESGIIKYFKLKSEMNKLQTEINKAQSEKKNLENEIDSLEKKFPAKIERVAREKYNMSRKNEIKIKVEQQSP